MASIAAQRGKWRQAHGGEQRRGVEDPGGEDVYGSRREKELQLFRREMASTRENPKTRQISPLELAGPSG
jgi:hypothetical protein